MSLKRQYNTPEIHIHSLDKEICLVMASVPPDPPPLLAPPASKAPADQSGLKSTQTEYPFGGDKPDYSNM